MNWLGRQIKRIVTLAVVTATLAGIILVFDALLAPDTDEIRPSAK